MRKGQSFNNYQSPFAFQRPLNSPNTDQFPAISQDHLRYRTKCRTCILTAVDLAVVLAKKDIEEEAEVICFQEVTCFRLTVMCRPPSCNLKTKYLALIVPMP